MLDVDYGGSTGYGRDYRKRLEGQWGIVDVDDCVAGAKYLAEQGLVDGERQAIRGGSASGFTTLAALAFTKQFDAGCTYFGIGDLRAFVKDTHKFESRYLESLVGPWPEAQQLYLDRSPSPARRADHGARAGPAGRGGQGRARRRRASGSSTRCSSVGSRTPTCSTRARTTASAASDAIIRSFGAELSFYAQVFGFEPADDIEPVRDPVPRRISRPYRGLGRRRSADI